MSKVFFTPFSIIGSLLAGIAARKVFERLWGLIDDEDPPDRSGESEQITRILIAVVLQSAVIAAAKVIFDRQARRAFRGLTGSWPGSEDKTGRIRAVPFEVGNFRHRLLSAAASSAHGEALVP